MKCIVTGAAGFIGSHLVDELLALGHEVAGIDAYVPYYPGAIKRENQALAFRSPRYAFHEIDLSGDLAAAKLAEAEAIFHLAAMPGLEQGAADLDNYWRCNVKAMDNLLRGLAQGPTALKRLIVASTSSVYGKHAVGDETLPTQPISYYGITKLAAEQLCRAAFAEHNLPVVLLRYFSVYGPRQRPDMAYHRFIRAMLSDAPIQVYGDGQQTRGNTFVTDCVKATIAALDAPSGAVYNVGGDEPASVWDVIGMLEALAGRKARIENVPARAKDQRATMANTEKIRQQLGWRPQVSLADGLSRQWEWQRGSRR